ncbi:MAG: TIM-barrel domain-containing protein [Paludibacteraceae bacterium]
MKKLSIFFIIVAFNTALHAQTSKNKVFWKENFDNNEIPANWKNVALNDSNVIWFITDQPYPGSPGRNYQAPPIASESRGYHLQFAPGVRVGKNINKWKQESIHPNAYIQTNAIDCSTKKSVVLKFQQNFFWSSKWEQSDKKSGLIVAISNNGTDWKEYDVRNDISSAEDCPNPMNVELNITSVAAEQKTVYLRFLWRGMYQWYWMVDDIQLSEAFDTDIKALDMISHKTEGNDFKQKDTLQFRFVNLSSKPITSNVDCYLQVDKRPFQKITVSASKRQPINIIDTIRVIFPDINLTDMGIHKIKFYVDVENDLRRSNDTLNLELYSQACLVGNILSFGKKESNTYDIVCSNAQFKIQILRNDIFRILMAYDGEFTNPAGNDIIVNTPSEPIECNYSDEGKYYLIRTPQMAIRSYKTPLRFELYKGDNTTLIWKETQGITYGKETMQYLKRGKDEQFFGGGMQNGRFSHRGKTIKMTIDYNWEDGGNPNPATFYMSNNGYGAVRNTYAKGKYAFTDTVKLTHSESRFDCYYFVGNSLKETLGDYTDLTGKPFLMPRWALSMGDANCYNRGAKAGKTIGTTTTGFDGLTPSVIGLVADKYIENNMPRGWILPNDGYGCGYTDLGYVVSELKKRGFYTGLWTENGVEKMAREIGEYGTRLAKLDVAWVGPGFKFALDGMKQAYEGIENNSDERGFVWSVCGWTGSHRNSVLWTGDQYGTWNYIRWHIPTLIGSGLSAQNSATGDIDGIFGGSDSTYVRDLQWKCFTPVLMTMSGWAKKDRQPWVSGEPYTSINRKYLQLKQQFTPYMYTLCNEAYQTGVPAVRGLILEYPADTATYGEAVKYQFLLGKDMLVAPVYKPENKRDSIYLPEGTWFDYWDGTAYKGKTTLMNYSAPLEKLPLFVRAGAILPMYQKMMYDWERPTDTLTLKIYPCGDSSYTMYEDDGISREHRQGVFATTRFDVSSAEQQGTINLTINAAEGDFEGRLKKRTYLTDIKTNNPPKKVKFNGAKVKKTKSKLFFDKEESAWFYDAQHGMLYVKTPTVSTDIKSNLIIKN